MKKLLTLCLFSLFNCVTMFAQPNSIILQDGAGTLISNHSSIQEAYNAIPSTLTQAYKIEITSNYNASAESFPVTFINKPGASAANTIRIYTTPTLSNTMIVNHDGLLGSALVFNDADWIIISGQNANFANMLRFNNTASSLAFPVVQFINGSCNNRIDSCIFQISPLNITMIPIMEFGTSAGAPGGNSDNIIHGCYFNNNTVDILSQGTISNPNRNNLITCNKLYPNGIGIWVKEGTGKITIDSNYIDCHSLGIMLDVADIVLEDIADSVIITRNRMRNYLISAPGETMRGIHVKSTSGSNAYTFLANNAICFQQAENQHGLLTDNNTYITGIEYDGSFAVQADIFHNTVRLQEQLDSTVALAGYSACFKRTGSNSANVYDIRNNIFSSKRYGQTEEHLAMDLEHTTGSLLIDHNDYSDNLSYCIRYNNSLYNTFAAYQAVIGGANEVNSTGALAEFQGPFDHHVYGTMVNNSTYYGTLIAGINDDIEGDARINPYMGCDEYAVNCTNGPVNIYFGPVMAMCPGDTFLISSDLIFYGNGNLWQWQSRPAGTTGPFIDIPGATEYVIVTSVQQSTEFRLQRSCADNSFANYSPVHTVNINPLPSAAGILESHLGMDYDFSADNPQNVTLFIWDFGDGSILDSTATPSHTYSDTGDHTVTLVIMNNCGSDTLTITVNPQPLNIDVFDVRNAISLFPNPSSNEVHIISGNIAIESVVIYNTLGAVIPVKNVLTGKELEISSLATGHYIVQIRTDKGIIYKKLQVHR